MKVIIAGTRNFDDYTLLKEVIDGLDLDITEIVSGKSKGADTLGERYAKEKSIKIKEFNANWAKFGRAAGPIRNKEMAEYSDVLIVFWNGESKGTKSMIKLSEKNNLKSYIIQTNEN